MTALYLEKIALRQFRSFASVDVELAPEPGVLIVHGSKACLKQAKTCAGRLRPLWADGSRL